MKVEFTAKGGRDLEKEEALKYLVLNEEYEIEDAQVGSWYSSVMVNGKWYNSVLFDNILVSDLLEEFPDSKDFYRA